MKDRILVTGAFGQIGSELTFALRNIYGNDNVVASDVKEPLADELSNGPFEVLDVTNIHAVNNILSKHKISQVYHLAAILSASGERNPMQAWKVNSEGLLNILEACVTQKIGKLFWPSTIAIFGHNTPKAAAPQHTITEPTTVYGISKLAGEGWCQYYFQKEGLDVRSLRFPGIVSYKSKPGGGTTDYAVDIFNEAVQHAQFKCFLNPDTYLPMMYMPDAIRATIELMETSGEHLRIRTSYNVSGMSFCPSELAEAIQHHIPHFKIEYQPDFRQEIAASWPAAIDDTYAQQDWNWSPEFNLEDMTADMLKNIPVGENTSNNF